MHGIDLHSTVSGWLEYVPDDWSAARLGTWNCKPHDIHLTLLYFPKIHIHSGLLEWIDNLLHVIPLRVPVYLTGDLQKFAMDTWVATVMPSTQLTLVQSDLASMCKGNGLKASTKYDFQPHFTIGDGLIRPVIELNPEWDIKLTGVRFHLGKTYIGRSVPLSPVVE